MIYIYCCCKLDSTFLENKNAVNPYAYMGDPR